MQFHIAYDSSKAWTHAQLCAQVPRPDLDALEPLPLGDNSNAAPHPLPVPSPMPLGDKETTIPAGNSISDGVPDVSDHAAPALTASPEEIEAPTSSGIQKHDSPEGVSPCPNSEDIANAPAEGALSVKIKTEPMSSPVEPADIDVEKHMPQQLEAIKKNWQILLKVKKEKTTQKGQMCVPSI